MEVPKEVVEVLKNAQVKLQDCLDCVYEDRDPPNESDCLAADRTHTLAKLMNNNTVAQLEAIFDFEDMDEPFGIARTKKKDTNKKKAYYVAYLIICLKHNCGEDMRGRPSVACWQPQVGRELEAARRIARGIVSGGVWRRGRRDRRGRRTELGGPLEGCTIAARAGRRSRIPGAI